MRIAQTHSTVNVFSAPTGTKRNVFTANTYTFGNLQSATVYTVGSGKYAYLIFASLFVAIPEPATQFNHVVGEIQFKQASGEWASILRCDLLTNLDDYGETKSSRIEIKMDSGDSIMIVSRGYGSGGLYAIRTFLQIMEFDK